MHYEKKSNGYEVLQSILEVRQVSFLYTPETFTSMIYSGMSFPLKVLWVVKKKLLDPRQSKWIFIQL